MKEREKTTKIFDQICFSFIMGIAKILWTQTYHISLRNGPYNVRIKRQPIQNSLAIVQMEFRNLNTYVDTIYFYDVESTLSLSAGTLGIGAPLLFARLFGVHMANTGVSNVEGLRLRITLRLYEVHIICIYSSYIYICIRFVVFV